MPNFVLPVPRSCDFLTFGTFGPVFVGFSFAATSIALIYERSNAWQSDDGSNMSLRRLKCPFSDTRSMAPVFIGHFLRSTFWLSHARSLAHLACLCLDARMCDYWNFCPFGRSVVGRSVAGTSRMPNFRLPVARTRYFWAFGTFGHIFVGYSVAGPFIARIYELLNVWQSDDRSNMSLRHLKCPFLDARLMAPVSIRHILHSSFWFSDARSLAHMACLFLDARTCDY